MKATLPLISARTFELNGAMDQITVTPQLGVTGTLPVELRLRPTEQTDTGGGFDPDTQNVDVVFGDASSSSWWGTETDLIRRSARMRVPSSSP